MARVLLTAKGKTFVERARMKASAILGVLIVALNCHAADANPRSDYSDIDVVSVTPRNPDTKPFVMAVLTKQQQERFAAATLKKTAAKDQLQGR